MQCATQSGPNSCLGAPCEQHPPWKVPRCSFHARQSKKFCLCTKCCNDWTMAEEENTAKCKGVLVLFMSCTNGVGHAKDHKFTVQDLACLTSLDVVAWFNCKACGTVMLGMNDQPTQGRSNSLLHHRKCTSFFMLSRFSTHACSIVSQTTTSLQSHSLHSRIALTNVTF